MENRNKQKGIRIRRILLGLSIVVIVMILSEIIYINHFYDRSSILNGITDPIVDALAGGIILAALAWVALLFVYFVGKATYLATVEEMEIKKNSISSMSDIYSFIYIIDIVKNELVPVVADEESEKLRPKHLPASEQLKYFFEYDSEEAYVENMLAYCDFSKLVEHLDNKNTIAFEYKSKLRGWAEIRYFAFERKEDAPLEKILFTIRNINDERTEMELFESRVDEAERESKAKSAFLANMSHEIRTPINSVIGFDTMILRESKDPVIKSYAKNINSAANMLLSIINGILDVSKLEADKMELVEEEYSLKQMLHEVVSMVKARTEFDKLDFICDVSPNICDRLYGDSVRLKQVITNLITNAAKYTDEGSVKLSVFGKNHGGSMHLLISIKDTGIGISKEDLKKVSERFQRFDSKRNHSVEGTGIGLNLVTGILGLMGSQLHVVSEYGSGSEFYFELEQKIADETPIGKVDLTEDVSADEDYGVLFTAPEAKLLVVDDNSMNLNVFTNLLKDTQVQIDTAGSGMAALEMSGSKKYDLIFMDHMMPEMDGIETFERIRADKTAPNADTPVVILTANAVKGAQEEYKATGFDDFLSKPIQSELLEKTIIKFLDPSKVNMNTSAKKNEAEVVLPIMSGVDTTYGLNHTGGITAYMSLLNQFCLVAANDLAELMSYVEEIKKDPANSAAVNNFRIKVHSMKASANVMGALQVYGIAATLEELAAANDTDGIVTLAAYFEKSWTKLRDELEANLPKSEEKGEVVDKEVLEALLHQLETSIKAYDIKASDEITGRLKTFSWEGDKAELIKKLEIEVSNLNAENVVAICNELRA